MGAIRRLVQREIGQRLLKCLITSLMLTNYNQPILTKQSFQSSSPDAEAQEHVLKRALVHERQLAKAL